MAETKDGSRERRTRAAEVVDAATEGADRLARWTPQQTIQVSCLLLLACLCAGFAAQLWAAQRQSERRDAEVREQFAAQLREHNAQAELARVHCAAEAEKSRREHAETVKTILAFQREENAKFRAEIVAALREKGP